MRTSNRDQVVGKILFGLAIVALAGIVTGCATGGMVQTKQSMKYQQQYPNSQPVESDPNAANPYAPSK